MESLRPGFGQRITAARVIAGHKNVDSLAARIRENGDMPRGLGTTTLRQMERGELTPTYPHLIVIALACNLPIAWFSADFQRVGEISEDPRRTIARETAAALQRAAERRASMPPAPPPPHEEDL